MFDDLSRIRLKKIQSAVIFPGRSGYTKQRFFEGGLREICIVLVSLHLSGTYRWNIPGQSPLSTFSEDGLESGKITI